MTDAELDALLDGAAGGVLTLAGPDGPIRVYFTRHDLRAPAAWRAALRRQLGHLGYEPPDHDQGGHDVLVRAMFALAGSEVRVT